VFQFGCHYAAEFAADALDAVRAGQQRKQRRSAPSEEPVFRGQLFFDHARERDQNLVARLSAEPHVQDLQAVQDEDRGVGAGSLPARFGERGFGFWPEMQPGESSPARRLLARRLKQVSGLDSARD